MSTQEQREKAVEEMNANFSIEGFKPDAHDLAMQQEYIQGEASVSDLLRDAARFAEEAGKKK